MKTDIKKDIKRIWAAAKSPELKLTDEELHLFVHALTGKDSIRALTAAEAKKVTGALAHMKESARKEGRKRRASGTTATENQRRKIHK